MVKLTDFGISRILDHIFTRTQASRAHESVVACIVGFGRIVHWCSSQVLVHASERHE